MPRYFVTTELGITKSITGTSIKNTYTINNPLTAPNPAPSNPSTYFKAGSFKIALKTKAPIVPVALIDSYKVFNSFCLGPVTTQVHYLKPILYDEYGGLKTHEIADLVKVRIQEKLDEVLKPAEAPVG